MSLHESPCPFGVLVLSVVKHDYIARGVAQHPRFKLRVVADEPNQPAWVHERNEKFALEHGHFHMSQTSSRPLTTIDVKVANRIRPKLSEHCALSVKASKCRFALSSRTNRSSNSLAECDRVVEAVQRNGVKFLMWNRNLLPAIAQARDVLARRELGKLHAFHVDFYFAKDAGPPKGSRGLGAAPLNWLESLKSAHATGADGGVGVEPMGELSNEGCYPLAFITALTGERVRRVFARTTAHFHQLYVDNEVEDLASVTLEFESGMVGSLAVGRIGNASHPDIGEIKLRILGSQGALVVSEARPEVGIYYRGQSPTEFKHERFCASENDDRLAENFARAIDNDGPTLLDAPTSRSITATVMAALESGRTGRNVEVS